MKLRCYAVFDKAVQAFHPPLCFRSENEAKRSFADAVNGQPGLAAHKADYAFAFIGEYDDNLGQMFSNPGGPVVVAEAVTVAAALDPVEGS